MLVDAVKPTGVDRPWLPAMAGEGDGAEMMIRLPNTTTPSRSVDATPSDADLGGDD
jgi:competence protein ComEC